MDPHERHEDKEVDSLDGFTFWRTKLKSAKMVVAPMVDQSELAWRILCRRHGAELCYTPMYHASVFMRDAVYRRDALASCPEDRPLIVQFCANDPEALLKAARYVESYCEAVDLNLGCPQAIAKRGHYGAYLQDEWGLITKIVSLCARELHVPITCKMRVFEDVEKTVQYAKMLEAAGCKLLTVHGRTREQKGPNTGVASWKHVKAVKEALKIPVFANGNIQNYPDVARCIQETGADGVMTAEGNLHNPAIFSNKDNTAMDLALEYLDIVEQYPCPMSFVRGHMFKMCHHILLMHTDMRILLGSSKSLSEMRSVVEKLKEKTLHDVKKYAANPEGYMLENQHLPLPYWICQPYVRPTPEESEKRQKDRQNSKRHLADVVVNCDDILSVNKQKKLYRNPKKSFQVKGDKFDKCKQCANPRGLKCEFSLCKVCCKKKMHHDVLDCPGHKLYAKAKLKQKSLTDIQEMTTIDALAHTCIEQSDIDSCLKSSTSKPCQLNNDAQNDSIGTAESNSSNDDCDKHDVLAATGT